MAKLDKKQLEDLLNQLENAVEKLGRDEESLYGGDLHQTRVHTVNARSELLHFISTRYAVTFNGLKWEVK